MGHWFTKTVLIIGFFALMGVIWGKMRPVKVEHLYVDLQPSYRHNILSMIRAEEHEIRDSVEKQVTTELNTVENSSLFTREKENTDSTRKTNKNKLDFQLKSLEDSPALFANPEAKGNEIIKEDKSVEKIPEKKEQESKKAPSDPGFFSKVKNFFVGLFYTDRLKQREEIKKEVENMERMSISQKTEQDSKKNIDQIKTPANNPQNKAKHSIEKPTQESLVSPDFLLDDILPSQPTK